MTFDEQIELLQLAHDAASEYILGKEVMDSMATRRAQEEAKAKMEAAEAALQEYVDRNPDVDANPALHRKLVEERRIANDEFIETMK